MVHLTRPSGVYLHRIYHHLQRGGVIAYPTEGSYGLGCLPHHAVGLRRVIRLKKRPQYKGLIVVGENSQQLQPLLRQLPQTTQQHLNATWPAPKTFLLPAHPLTPTLLRGRSRTTLAVRVPDHEPARFLCHVLKTALVSTSCNRSGQKTCHSTRDVWRKFGQQVMIIGGRTGGRKKPSDIIDWESGIKLR